jgi:hypothetical protein
MGMQQAWVRREIDIVFLVGIQNEGGPLGRYRRRWENNIKMDLREI